MLLSREELTSIFRQGDGWSEFRRRYSADQLIDVSRVAFNHDMNQALVYISSTSGSKSRVGSYVLLVKDGETWTIRHKLDAWVS